MIIFVLDICNYIVFALTLTVPLHARDDVPKRVLRLSTLLPRFDNTNVSGKPSGESKSCPTVAAF